ncbi:unnamed protein product [Vicia faba]|uniref:Uncharacterized protein n=1 Tax=Vicia faba TaxID=3906 RepID=A0AAV1A375_VICFA|nr:unnamed protein product [Vicia faba]
MLFNSIYVSKLGFNDSLGYGSSLIPSISDIRYFFIHVLIWINGGPGCSSYGRGTIFENRGLVKNPDSWNKIANMLYLDAPAGFGLSYSNNTADYSLVLNDEFAARDNLVFLQHWFNKFSHNKINDFYISGEKYAGVALEVDILGYVNLPCYYVIGLNVGRVLGKLLVLLLENPYTLGFAN